MIRKFINTLKTNPDFITLIKKLKSTSIIGLQGVPMFTVAVFFIEAIKKGSITTRAASMSFKFFLALFPAIIFLFTLIPFIPVDNFQEELLSQLKIILPHDAYSLTISTIEDLVKNKQGSLLSIGFLSALYFAADGVNAIMDAFNESVYISKTQSFLKKRLKAFMLTFIISILVISSVVAIVFGQLFLSFLLDKGFLVSLISYYLLMFLNWIVIFILFYFTISFLYYFGSAKKTKWKFFTVGSTVTTFLMIITSIGFAWYINNFGQYNKIYGSIGTLMVIMLWINLNSLLLLLGFELNTSIEEAKHEK